MADLTLFLLFIMTISVPVIATIAELSSTTPNSVFHSVVRSIICLGCLFFLSQLMQPHYVASAAHILTIFIVFIVSVVQLTLELHHTSIDKVLQKFKDREHNI